jgi:hypothetical protein
MQVICLASSGSGEKTLISERKQLLTPKQQLRLKVLSLDPILLKLGDYSVHTDNVRTYNRLTGETVLGSPYTISAVLTPAAVEVT